MPFPSLLPEPCEATAVAGGRLALGLTPRALLLLLAGLLFLVPAFFISAFAWGMLLWDVAVLALAAIDCLRLPAPHQFRVRRTWLSLPAQSVETGIELTCEYSGSTPLRLSVVDDLPDALTLAPATAPLTLYPHVAGSVRYTIRPRQRGDHNAGAVYLEYRSGVGLVGRWARAELTQTVRVYPYRRPADGSDIFLARTRQIEQQLRRQRLRGLGRDFESLRDYREGDDLRDICWTATARRGSIVTRQYQVEKSQPVWIVVDTGRLLQAEVRTSTKLDYATSTSLALAQLALTGGDRVGLLAYGQQIKQRVPLGRGSHHLRQLVDALATTQGEFAESDHLKATVTLNRLQSRRSLVLWITDVAETAMTPEVIEGASLLVRHHLLLFVCMRNDQLLELAAASPATAAAMYRRAAAQDLLHLRETLLARLRERGAMTLETTPTEMTAAVLNRYLEVKERALL
jgi:uncharacterized protein (DUF58 family)